MISEAVDGMLPTYQEKMDYKYHLPISSKVGEKQNHGFREHDVLFGVITSVLTGSAQERNSEEQRNFCTMESQRFLKRKKKEK